MTLLAPALCPRCGRPADRQYHDVYEAIKNHSLCRNIADCHREQERQQREANGTR